MAGFKVSIGADSKNAERELSRFEKKTRGIAKSIAKGFKERIGMRMFDGLLGAANKIPSILGEAVKSASSLNEQIGKSEAVFGDSADAIKNWSQGTADALGMAKAESLEAAGSFGTFLNAMKFSDKEAADMSKTLVELAADMGSFNDATNEETITALLAALRGEKEPISRLGVSFSAATLETKAFEMGLVDAKGALDDKTKAMAVYETILEQTGRQQGNFADTSEDFANAKKRLDAKLKDLSTTIGQALLPALEEFVNFLNDSDPESWGDAVVDGLNLILDGVEAVRKAWEGLKMLGFAVTGQGDKARQVEQEAIQRQVERNGLLELAPEADLSPEEIDKLQRRRQFDPKRLTPASEDFSGLFEAAASGKSKMQADLAAQIEKKQREQRERKINRQVDADIRAEKEASQKQQDQERMESLKNQFFKAEGVLSGLSGQSGISAVSSMQRIGGGGGVATNQLDLQKRQATIQADILEILKKMQSIQPGVEISDF